MIPLRRGKIERIVYQHIVKKIRRDLVQFVARTVQHNGVKLAYFGKLVYKSVHAPPLKMHKVFVYT